MEENSKYYTPDISDLFIGYECEKESWDKDGCDIWVNHKIGFEYGWLEIPENYNERLRTKYLDKEDIESLGFKETIEKNVPIYELQIPQEGFNEWRYYKICNGFKYYKITETTEGSWGNFTETIFTGEIKSINELKKIMKYLNIPTNG